MFIRSGQREDSGVYEVMVKVDSFEDKADFTLQVVGESCVCDHVNKKLVDAVYFLDIPDVSDKLISWIWILQLAPTATELNSSNILSNPEFKATNADKTVYLLS